MTSAASKPLRIAFLTPEFVTNVAGSSGLASYLSRITSALKSLGHDVEVFCAV
jgi:hypothetical protein